MSNALNLYQQFLNYLYQTKAIEVPSDFHARCNKVKTLIDNDVTGVVNSILKYAIDSASETKYRVECKNETLQEVLNTWLSEINLEVEGIPTGLSELSKEYLQERLKGSSFCVAKASDWKKLKVDNTEIEVPKIMWYMNGASIYVKRPDKKPFILGSDKLYLDPEYKTPLTSNKNESVIIQKPYSRWQDEYPNIYLIQNGVYKNWKAIEILQSKSDQVLSKIIPYLFLMQKGTLEEFLKGNINYSDKELTEMVNGFKNELEKYNAQQDKTPVDGIPFDVKYEHLIPDLTKILSEELYRQGYRAILSGLGFIDVIQGLTSTRKEAVLNPKPFIAEINSCVSGFKSMLLEVVYEIIQRNKSKHPKFFSDRANIYIVNSPLKINVEQILDSIRQGYDRGPVSIQTFQETLGLDPQTERERSKKEAENGDQELYYPHIITNQEAKGIDIVQPSKPKTKKEENLEKEGKKPGSPEVKKYKNAEITFKKDEKISIKPGKYPIAQELSNEELWVRNGFCEWRDVQVGYIFDEKFNVARFGLDAYVFITKEDLVKEINTANENLEMAPYTMDTYPNYLKKYPKDAIAVWVEVFNKTLKDTNDESKAFPYAWSAMKRFLKKNYVKQPDGTYKKK